MTKRLGRFAGIVTVVVVCSAILLVVPITLFDASPILSAMFLAVILGAFAVAWVADLMYRKSFPNLFRAFGKDRQNRKAAAEGDE